MKSIVLQGTVIFIAAMCADVLWTKVVNPWLNRRAEQKRKELVSILIDPTRTWGDVLEVRRKKGKTRYYKNGWRVSEKTYDKEFCAILKRISERGSKEDISSAPAK